MNGARRRRANVERDGELGQLRAILETQGVRGAPPHAAGRESAFDAGDAEEIAALLDDWAAKYHAKSVAILAPNGARELAEDVASRLAPRHDVRVGEDRAQATRVDMVLVLEAIEPESGEDVRSGARSGEGESRGESDWARALERLGEKAARVVVVVVRNPCALLARWSAPAPPEMARTALIAPVLWRIGRVRDHAYFGVPRSSHAILAPLGAFAERLPSRWLERIARFHAFAVDTTPRTPQARRHVRLPIEKATRSEP